MAAPTQSSRFWTTGGAGDGAATYTRDQLAEVFRNAFLSDATTQGVFSGLGVTGTSSPLTIAIGASCVYGFLHFITVAGDMTVATPAVGTTGWHIVLRADWTAQTVRAVAVRNTDGVSAVPSLTQTAGTTWEIRVASGTITTLGAIAVTDTRVFCAGPAKLTSGRIPFATTGGQITDSANLNWDSSNNRLGLKKSSPSATVHIDEAASGLRETIRLENSSNSSSSGSQITHYNSGTGVLAAYINLKRNGAGIDTLVELGATADETATTATTRLAVGSAGATLTGVATINPASATAPLVLGANGQGQKVTGLNADQIDGLDLSAGRQGGSATDWNSPGLTNRTVTNIRMYFGEIQWTGAAAASGSVNVTFPGSFSGLALMVANCLTPGVLTNCNTTAVNAGSIFWNDTGGFTRTLLNIMWVAFGPE